MSDASRVRVEAILLFHETQPSSQQHAASASVDRPTTTISSGVDDDSGKGRPRAARGRHRGASESSSDDDEGAPRSWGVCSSRGGLRLILLEVVTVATVVWSLYFVFFAGPFHTTLKPS